MSKPKRSLYYVQPRFEIGDMVRFRGERRVIRAVYGLNTGNRPQYSVEGILGIYAEQHFRKIKKRGDK